MHRLWSVIVLALVFTALSAGAIPSQAAVTRTETARAATVDEMPARYVVQLADEPLALYDGGVAGLAPTMPAARGELRLAPASPDSVAYYAYLDSRHAAAVSAIEAAVGHSVEVVFHYRTAFNGLAVVLTASEAATVAGLTGVVRVHREEILQLLTDNGPAWMNADAVWSGAATGTGSKGEGVVAGIIDTGVNSDHPSFADIGGDGFDHTNPRIVRFGVCAVNVLKCNDKLIGMYDFTGTGEEDDAGHGSHTASTTAGNVIDSTLYAPTTTLGPRRISGVAPHANIISYKACTDQVVPVVTDLLGGCPLTALFAAIDQATADVVDVINFSIGGGSSDPWTGIFGQPFFGTQAAGVFVAASAGNAGPGPQTIGSPSNAPWVMSVGASTHDRMTRGTVTTTSAAGPGPTLVGSSITSAAGPAPVIDARALGNELCNPFNAAQAAQVAGKIVLCTVGTIARVAKGQNVGAAGGVGMVLIGSPGSKASFVADTHFIPTVMIGQWDGDALRAWLAGATDPQATLSGVSLVEDPAIADRMAYFSSRGPDLTSPKVIKPDVTAPGVAIWAAFHEHSGPAGTAEYNIIQGTSMSSPHAAGAAVLVRALNPFWTPDHVKSALMSTGFTAPDGGKEVQPVVKEDHTTAADPFDYGGGRVDVARAVNAGFVLQESLDGYQAANPQAGGDPRQLNLASLADDDCKATCAWTRTLASAQTKDVTYTVSVSSGPGFTLSVSPASFTLPKQLVKGVVDPLTTQAITVTATNNGIVPTKWQFGTITFTPDDPSIPAQHFPVAVTSKGGNLEQPCQIPFTTVVTDPNDIVGIVEPGWEITEVQAAGLFPTFAGESKPNVTFRLKVESLDPLPAESFWQVEFVPPGTPTGTRYFVRMARGTGDVAFSYGTITGNQFTTLGAVESGSFTPDGWIEWTIATSKILNPGVGSTIASIAGAAGTGHPGVFTSGRDSTGAGSYTLRSCGEDPGPTANADSATTTADTPVVIDVLANDVSGDGSALTITDVTDPANGTAANNGDGTITYTPDAGFSGGDSFTYTVSDARGRTASAVVTVSVAPFCPTTSTSYDFESGSAGWSVETAANELGDASPTWQVLADPFAHSGLFSFTSNSSGATKDDRLIAPAVRLTAFSRITLWHRWGFEDGFDGGVLEVSLDGGGTWRDITDPIIGARFISGAYNGIISANDGSAIAGRLAWTGTSTNHALGTESESVVDVGVLAGREAIFRFRLVTDALVPGTAWWIDDVTFSGLATDCNEPPVANPDSAVTQEGTPVTIAVLANDTDPDGDDLTVGRVDDPANGTAVINGDGTITYTPDAGFTGTETFTYTAFDGEWEDTATVTVTVEERPNTAPVANDDTVTTARNTAVRIAVLANDRDAEGDALTIASFTQPTQGRVADNGDGTLTYTPPLNFSGVETFTYTIDDAHGGTDTANVTVNVGEPGAPIACFTRSPKKPKAGQETRFDARCSSDDTASDDQLLFEWDFDSDGTFDATGMRTTFTFAVPGTYTVTLRVTDPGGSRDVLRREFDVR